jgi:hypothetical protein
MAIVQSVGLLKGKILNMLKSGKYPNKQCLPVRWQPQLVKEKTLASGCVYTLGHRVTESDGMK